MLITPEIFIAMRCPYCQRQILFRTFSLFHFQDDVPYKITCDCGASPLSLRLSGKKHLYIDTICPVCPDEHNYIYHLDEIKNNQVISLSCIDTDIHLAYLGRRISVLKALNEEGQLIIDYADELKDYFLYPSLMAKILLCFNNYFIHDKVHCAKCSSNDFNLEVFSDRAVLRCVHCKSTAWLYASRKSDLYLLKKLGKIILQPEKQERLSYRIANQKNRKRL